MKLDIYLKVIFFIIIMRIKEGKEEKVERGYIKKEKLKEKSLEWVVKI